MASNLKKQCGTDLGRAFDQFIELLNSREGIMTEDNVRYSIKERGFRGLFLYVTDGEMDKYLSGGSNKYRDALHKFYCMDQGQEETIVFDAPKANDGAPKTFWESAFTSMDKAGMQNNSFQVKVRLLQGTPLPEQQGDSPQWHVRLYEVL